MAATYPTGVYVPRTKENRNGVVYDPLKTTVGYAEDVTKLDDEVVALQTIIGLNPQGIFATLLERLEDLEARVTALEP